MVKPKLKTSSDRLRRVLLKAAVGREVERLWIGGMGNELAG